MVNIMLMRVAIMIDVFRFVRRIFMICKIKIIEKSQKAHDTSDKIFSLTTV